MNSKRLQTEGTRQIKVLRTGNLSDGREFRFRQVQSAFFIETRAPGEDFKTEVFIHSHTLDPRGIAANRRKAQKFLTELILGQR